MEHDHSSHQNHSENDHQNHHEMMIADFKKRLWISLLITLPILVMAPMIQSLVGYEFRFEGDRYVQLVLSSIIFIYGGWPFLKGLVDEVKDRSPGMMTLIALAVAVAYVYSSAVVLGLGGKIFFWELASLIDIMLLGHWIEMKSVMRASNALQELAKLMPDTAHRIVDGDTEEVNVSELEVDDVILVRPGEKIPSDGVIVEGKSQINESMITGESKPVSKSENDEVIGGSINDNGSLHIRVTHGEDDSYLSKVINMVEEAQKVKSKSQNIANRAAGWLFYLALGSGILTLTVWLSLGKEFEYALERMVTVMIISCPHALGLAVPLVAAISTSMSAKNGLLIRNRTAFENARKITTVLFDKTGTLTKGEFGVSKVRTFSDAVTDSELIQIAASVESHSEHPIARGILKYAEQEGIEKVDSKDFESTSGKGVQSEVEGKTVRVVSPGVLESENIEIPSEVKSSDQETVVFVIREGELVGSIALSDSIREESYEAVRLLRDRGIRLVMATGDNAQVAKAVSEELSLDDYHAEVLPDDKQKIVKELQENGEFVAMTGDGINDAPALAQADVGIAIGSGTDVAAETADIILVNSNPMDIAKLISFGSATYSKMMQNLWWAAGYNIVAVPLAAGVLAGVGIILSPALGAALMSLSTVVVAVNAQLLRR